MPLTKYDLYSILKVHEIFFIKSAIFCLFYNVYKDKLCTVEIEDGRKFLFVLVLQCIQRQYVHIWNRRWSRSAQKLSFKYALLRFVLNSFIMYRLFFRNMYIYNFVLVLSLFQKCRFYTKRNLVRLNSMKKIKGIIFLF